MIDDLLKAKKENKVYFGKGVLSQTPDWAAFIRLMDRKFNNPSGYAWDDQLMSHLLPNGERKATDILIYNKMDPVIFKAVECVDGQIIDNQIPEGQPFVDILSSVFKNFHLKAIINFIGNESKYWIHKDDHYVISWGCIGNVEWKIYPDTPEDQMENLRTSNDYVSYILGPGDILFCPKGAIHEVNITEPRASLIFQAFE